MRKAHVAIALMGLLPVYAAVGIAYAQSGPPAAPQRMIFVPEEDAATAKPLAQRVSARPRSSRGTRRAAAKPAKSATKTVSAAASKAVAAPLPRPAPERPGAAGKAAAGDVPLPLRAPHRRLALANANAAAAPVAVPAIERETDPYAADAGAVRSEDGAEPAMDVFAFVAGRRPDAIAAKAQQAPLAEAAVPVPSAPAAAPLRQGDRTHVARSVAAVFDQLANLPVRGQLVAAARPTDADDALLSPEPVLPPWPAEPVPAAGPDVAPTASAVPALGQGSEASTVGASEAASQAAAPTSDGPDPALTPDAPALSSFAASPVPPDRAAAPSDAASPGPAARVAALPTPSSAVSSPAAGSAQSAEPEPSSEPDPVRIPRYRDVPETVRQIGESLPDCTPDERGTTRRPFGSRVLFALSCTGNGQSERHAFVLARTDDGEGANVLMFPRPGGGQVGPYMHQLSNPQVFATRLEITHAGMDPDERPCRTDGRWRVDARGNAGLVSWRTAANCSGEMAAAAPATVKKAAATKGKSAKRPVRAKSRPAKRKRVRR